MKNIKYITIEITNTCNLRCKFCGIWKEGVKSFLSPDEIKNILSAVDNVSVSITGGECFLHPDFEGIYKSIFRLFLRGKVNSINITTNGYEHDRIMEFLNRNRRFLMGLEFGISIDGIKERHNELRGKDDAFEKTMSTILDIRKHYPRIPVSLKMVMTKLNFRDIYRVYLLSLRLGCFFEPKFAEYVPQYYNRTEKNNIAVLSQKEMKKIEKQLLEIKKNEEGLKRKRSMFHISALLKLLKDPGMGFIKKCLTPSKSLFIDCRGNIFPCLYQKPIGNIKKKPLSDILSGGKNEKIIRSALKGECPKCLSYHGFLKSCNMEQI